MFSPVTRGNALRQWLLVVGVAVVLPGCVGLQDAMFSPLLNPEDFDATPAHYRHQSCEDLTNALPLYQDQQVRAPQNRLWTWHVDAIRQVQAEKNCAGGGTAATQATAGGAANDKSILGIQMEPMTPSLAKALRLPSVRGVLVQEVREFTPAEKAGITSMDVVLKLADIEVVSPEQLLALVVAMPVGTKTNVLLWRDGDTIVVPVETMSNNAWQSLRASAPATSPAPGVPGAALAASAPTPAVTTGPMEYGYCTHTDVPSRRHYVSNVFNVVQTPDRDLGQEFFTHLSSFNRLGDRFAVCDIQPTYELALRAQKKSKKTFWLSAKIVDVDWSPAPR